MNVSRIIAAILLLSACNNGGDVALNRCPDVVFNEVLASSHDRKLEGETIDWIELFNASDETVDLEGWSLSTIETVRDYTFPSSTPLEPGGFLLLLADSYQGTYFDLNRDGDSLFLRGPLKEGGLLCDDLRYPDQHADFSWQRASDGEGDWCAATGVTPGNSNNDTPCMCADDTGTSDTGASSWC